MIKVKLIKKYSFQDPYFINVGQVITVTKAKGKELIEGGIAELHETPNQRPYDPNKQINTLHKDQTEEE